MEVGNLPNIDTCLLNLTVEWRAWVAVVNFDKILGHCQKRLRTTALECCVRIRVFPHLLLILEHKIKWFILIFWVFSTKKTMWNT